MTICGGGAGASSSCLSRDMHSLRCVCVTLCAGGFVRRQPRCLRAASGEHTPELLLPANGSDYELHHARATRHGATKRHTRDTKVSHWPPMHARSQPPTTHAPSHRHARTAAGHAHTLLWLSSKCGGRARGLGWVGESLAGWDVTMPPDGHGNVHSHEGGGVVLSSARVLICCGPFGPPQACSVIHSVTRRDNSNVGLQLLTSLHTALPCLPRPHCPTAVPGAGRSSCWRTATTNPMT